MSKGFRKLLLCSLPEVSVDERRRDTLGEREPLGFRFQASNLIVAPRNRQAFVGWFSENTMDLPFTPVGTSCCGLIEVDTGISVVRLPQEVSQYGRETQGL
jgi:hypothetical protein